MGSAPKPVRHSPGVGGCAADTMGSIAQPPRRGETQPMARLKHIVLDVLKPHLVVVPFVETGVASAYQMESLNSLGSFHWYTGVFTTTFTGHCSVEHNINT